MINNFNSNNLKRKVKNFNTQEKTGTLEPSNIISESIYLKKDTFTEPQKIDKKTSYIHASSMMPDSYHLSKNFLSEVKIDMDKRKELAPTQCVLEKDGISMELYNFLWMKDSIFNFGCQNVLLAETIIIKNGIIKAWFFYLNGQIVKKRKENCNIENIIKSFIKNRDKKNKRKCDCVATFIKYDKEKKNEYEFQYLNEGELTDFANSFRTEGDSGILQKFLQPSGEKNTFYKFNYNKDLSSAEIQTSKANLYDEKINIYERCDIITGNSRMFETMALRSEIITKNMNEIVENIVRHVFRTSHETYLLDRGIFFFKQSHDNKLWFHFATSLKVHGTRDDLLQHLRFEKLILTIPSIIDTESTLINIKKGGLLKNSMCYHCMKTVPDTKIYEITNAQYLNFLDCKCHYYKIYPTEQISNLKVHYKNLEKLYKDREENHKMFTFVIGDKVNNRNDKEELKILQKTEDQQQSKKEKHVWINNTNNKSPNQSALILEDRSKPPPEQKKIPEVYKYLYPKINEKQYKELRKLDEFNRGIITICDFCYVDLLGFKISGGNQVINKFDATSKLKGTGMLMPDKGVKKYLVNVINKVNYKWVDDNYDTEELEKEINDKIINNNVIEGNLQILNAPNEGILNNKSGFINTGILFPDPKVLKEKLRVTQVFNDIMDIENDNKKQPDTVIDFIKNQRKNSAQHDIYGMRNISGASEEDNFSQDKHSENKSLENISDPTTFLDYKIIPNKLFRNQSEENFYKNNEKIKAQNSKHLVEDSQLNHSDFPRRGKKKLSFVKYDKVICNPLLRNGRHAERFFKGNAELFGEKQGQSAFTKKNSSILSKTQTIRKMNSRIKNRSLYDFDETSRIGEDPAERQYNKDTDYSSLGYTKDPVRILAKGIEESPVKYLLNSLTKTKIIDNKGSIYKKVSREKNYWKKQSVLFSMDNTLKNSTFDKDMSQSKLKYNEANKITSFKNVEKCSKNDISLKHNPFDSECTERIEKTGKDPVLNEDTDRNVFQMDEVEVDYNNGVNNFEDTEFKKVGQSSTAYENHQKFKSHKSSSNSGTNLNENGWYKLNDRNYLKNPNKNGECSKRKLFHQKSNSLIDLQKAQSPLNAINLSSLDSNSIRKKRNLFDKNKTQSNYTNFHKNALAYTLISNENQKRPNFMASSNNFHNYKEKTKFAPFGNTHKEKIKFI